MVHCPTFEYKSPYERAISALIAITAIVVIVYIPGKLGTRIKGSAGYTNLIVSMPVILAIGISITLVSTHRSIIKYLKMKLDDLY
jgi:cell division transport system permease protein